MKQDHESEGKCIYCGETHSQKSIVRHLASHLKKMQKEKPEERKTVFHLNVEAGIMQNS